MDRTTTTTIIDASLANGRITQPGVAYNVETIPNQVARYDGAFGYWGRQTARYRYRVIAAVNGNGFSTANGCPDSAMVINGVLAKRTFGSSGTENGGGMGFLYKLGGSSPTPGTPYLGGDLYLPANLDKNRISFDAGLTDFLRFNKVNDQPQNDVITLYTHHYGARTPTTTSVDEYIVKMQDSDPFRILPVPNATQGTVVEIKTNSSGNTPIPFDAIVIVVSGSMKDDVALKIPSVGTPVWISTETRDVDPGAWPSHPNVDYTNMYCAIGPMWGLILHGGAKSTSTSPSYISDVHPRTAVAFNASYIYFIVVDGRSTISGGMTLSELADWCISELGATDAVNNDGGGSSIMWVDGQVKNNPSDGSPRPVANGLMMIQLQPKETSTLFTAAQPVWTNNTVSLRTGPGNQFHVIQNVTLGTQVTVLDHGLNGLRAQDAGGNPGYWWYVETSGGQAGWAPQLYLSPSAAVDDWLLR
jgi:hypothetical protein